MQFETVVSLSSAVAALISTLFAASSARSAKKSLDIAVAENREKHESIYAELIDGFSWVSSENIKMVSFASTLINRSTLPNSIVSIELHVHEFEDSGKTSKLILRPISADAPHEWDLQPFPSPLNLNPKSAVSGWVSFRLPDNFASGKLIDKYEITFLSSSGKRVAVNQYLIRKVENAETGS